MIEWDSPDKFIGTTAALLSLAAAGVTAGASVAGAKMSSNANRAAGQTQADAINHGADLQKKSTDEALAYQKQQDADTAARYEAAQRGNYNQYVSRVKGAQQLGDTIGFHLPDAAEYVSSTGQGGPAAGASGGPSSGGADPKLTSAIAAYQAANPASKGIEGLTAALKGQGFNVDRFKYDGNVLSNNELNVNGQKYKVLGGENTPGAYWYQPGMNDSAPGASKGAGLPNSIASYLPQSSGGTSAPGYAQFPPQAQPFQLRTINAFVK